jgi:hypothetical protein
MVVALLFSGECELLLLKLNSRGSCPSAGEVCGGVRDNVFCSLGVGNAVVEAGL